MPAAPTDPPRFVPVRTAAGVPHLRLFRRRDGSRCAAVFSSLPALHELLGAQEEFTMLTERAVRALCEPLGVRRLLLDPRLVAPAARPVAAAAAPVVRPVVPVEGRPAPGQAVRSRRLR
ncbi:hypothetical protein C7C46_31695 [Streptomyces tateyamensis]|uniref:SseB protein N-terminal domain-containing protein n=1 Tax=Streptomyces tateyamensis TaxID=565073 RepID=A0A2V4NT86_9ACTN|nr:SAV_915 family protein [Streptomyces tateyamensis]PYC66060.1 hypothetical protein C7C46_31695 [Streptomyces tateyamensis]